MATNPGDIRLTDDYRKRLAKVADQKGTTWQTLLAQFVTQIEQTKPTGEQHTSDPLPPGFDEDTEYLALCLAELREMEAARNTDNRQALLEFDSAMFGHLSFVLANTVRAAVHSLTGGRLIGVPAKTDPALASYYRQANRLSVVLALISDISMGVLGGALKRKESITGRLGDILSQLYILSCVLKRFEDDGRPQADLPLVHWSAQDALLRAHAAYQEAPQTKEERDGEHPGEQRREPGPFDLPSVRHLGRFQLPYQVGIVDAHGGKGVQAGGVALPGRLDDRGHFVWR